mgnify:CR=1 FL=1
MADHPGTDLKIPDPVEMSRAMTRIAERSQHLVAEFLAKQATEGEKGSVDPLNI